MESKAPSLYSKFMEKLPKQLIEPSASNLTTPLVNNQQIDTLEELQSKFAKLSDYAETETGVKNEEKLTLIITAIQLIAKLDKTTQSQEFITYQDSLQLCYNDICKSDFLTNSEKAQLSFIVGNTNSLFDYYGEAITCYENAVSYEKLTLSPTSSSKTIHEYGSALIKMNIITAAYFQTTDPAPDLVSVHYEDAVKIADDMLELKLSKFTSQIYYLKAQALLHLSGHNFSSEKKVDKAMNNLLKAIFSAAKGCKLSKVAENQKNYFKLIQQCITILSNIITKFSLTNKNIIKEKLSPFDKISELKEIDNLLKVIDTLIKQIYQPKADQILAKKSSPIISPSINTKTDSSKENKQSTDPLFSIIK